MERAADAHTHFQNNLEQWVLAVIQANYSMRDEAVVKRVIDSCRSTLASNVNFHEYMAKFLTDDEPTMARQHRLLGRIYKALSSYPDEPGQVNYMA